MNRVGVTLFKVAGIIFIVAISCGQRLAPQTDIISIARALANQVPEIKGEFEVKLSVSDSCPPSWSDEQKRNYLSYYTGSEFSDFGNKKLQIYHYERPNSETDLVVVNYFDDYPYHPGLKWFTLDRKTGALTATQEPFSSEGYDEGWRRDYIIYSNGNILLFASPNMDLGNHAIIRWNETDGNLTFYRRNFGDGDDNPIYDNGSLEDNAEMEEYVKTVIRPNFQRINAVNNWDWVQNDKIYNMKYGENDATVDADVTYYYSASGLEKAVVKIQGKATYEYYLLNNILSFIYYVAYDNNGAVAKERRWYFQGYCFRGVGENGKKLTPEQIEDELPAYSAENYYISIYSDILGN